MHRVWSKIIDTDVFPECLDVRTIHLLHVRMPAYSAHDVFHIGKQLQLSTIFPTARDERVRSSLLSRIRSCERVLTFKTFHADMVLLEACYDPLRQLWPRDGGDLQQACRSSFQNEGGDFEASYLDIWLYSIKNHPKFSWLKNAGLKRVGGKAVSEFPEAAVAELATFAASRGFNSEMIEVMQTGERYEEHNDSAEVPSLSGAHHEICLRDRCGRPSKALFDTCWGQISPKSVTTKWVGPADRHATPFAVAKNFVRCLFKLEQPYEAQRTGNLYNVRRVAGISRPSSLILNRPGRSSTLLAPTLNLSQLGFDADAKATSQVDGADTMQFRRCKPAAACGMSTSFNRIQPMASETCGGSKTCDDGDEAPPAWRKRRSPDYEKTTAATLSRVKKTRRRGSYTGQPGGKGLRNLQLVEIHCPASRVIEAGSN
jgi:hypothetical protein